MTAGSDSLKGFKDIITTKKFKKVFPTLSLGLDKEVRYAYRGGFTWLNDRFKEKEIGEGMVFDVNSLYPAQMYSRLLPGDAGHDASGVEDPGLSTARCTNASGVRQPSEAVVWLCRS
jgi:hypothetical protein